MVWRCCRVADIIRCFRYSVVVMAVRAGLIQTIPRRWRNLRGAHTFHHHTKLALLAVNTLSSHSLTPHTLTPHTLTVHRHKHTDSNAYQQVCWSCHRNLPLNLQEEERGGGGDGGGRGGDVDSPRKVLFFCPCEKRVVLPPQSDVTYFDMMDCPISYQVDIVKLKETYKQLQKELHPDLFSLKSEEEQTFSAQQSSSINKAYSTLLRPHSRGLYMLKLRGMRVGEEEGKLLEPDFLETMWYLREELEDAITIGDTERLMSIEKQNMENLERITKEVGKSFQSGNYDAAKEGLARMKYFINIEDELRDTLHLPPSNF